MAEKRNEGEPEGEEKLSDDKVDDYFLEQKWSSDEDSIWEPDESLNFSDLIKTFEEVLNKNKMQGESSKTDKDEKKGKSKKASEFDRGLEPEEIIGATVKSGGLMFLMKWQGTDECTLVPAMQANAICPQIVSQFYKGKRRWSTPPSPPSADEKNAKN